MKVTSGYYDIKRCSKCNSIMASIKGGYKCFRCNIGVIL